METKSKAVFAPVIFASWPLNLAAACLLVISLSLGCCHVPGEGVCCTFGEAVPFFVDPRGEEVAFEMALKVLDFAWARGWTTVVDRVPDMVGRLLKVSLQEISNCEVVVRQNAHRGK